MVDDLGHALALAADHPEPVLDGAVRRLAVLDREQAVVGRSRFRKHGASPTLLTSCSGAPIMVSGKA
ncbi:MAG: hypothetical protein ACE5LF_10015, partial [Alphaproteobacteria bacterium]